MNWFILSPLMGEKPHILPYFQVRHSAMAPSSGSETKLNTDAQLQAKRYQNRIKIVSKLKRLMRKLRSQTLPFESVKDKIIKSKKDIKPH